LGRQKGGKVTGDAVKERRPRFLLGGTVVLTFRKSLKEGGTKGRQREFQGRVSSGGIVPIAGVKGIEEKPLSHSRNPLFRCILVPSVTARIYGAPDPPGWTWKSGRGDKKREMGIPPQKEKKKRRGLVWLGGGRRERRGQ